MALGFPFKDYNLVVSGTNVNLPLQTSGILGGKWFSPHIVLLFPAVETDLGPALVEIRQASRNFSLSLTIYFLGLEAVFDIH